MQSEKEFTIQPINEGTDAQSGPHKAHPGPAITQNMPKQEGSREDREAKKAELNK